MFINRSRKTNPSPLVERVCIDTGEIVSNFSKDRTAELDANPPTFTDIITWAADMGRMPSAEEIKLEQARQKRNLRRQWTSCEDPDGPGGAA